MTGWSKSNASNRSSSAGLLVGTYGLFFAIFGLGRLSRLRVVSGWSFQLRSMNLRIEVKSAVSAEQKALNNALSQIEKTFGAGAIMKLGEGSHLEVDGISTGALSLDLALGGKGLPRGRIIELFGPESSGERTRPIVLAVVRPSDTDAG